MSDNQTTQEQTVDQVLAERPDLQYLKSAGEDIAEFLPDPGLRRDADDAAAKEAEAKAAAEKAAADAAAAAGKTADDAEPGEVVVGDDGRIRDTKGRFVPTKALHDERRRRQDAEKALQDAQAKLLQLATSAAPAKVGEDGKAKDGKPANPFEEADIDPAVDVVGATMQERRRNAWLRSQHETSVKATGEQLTHSDMMQAYRDDTARFVAARPDYPDAYKHVVVKRAEELIALGVTDKATVNKQICEDEVDIVRLATANGRSSAEVIYRLAVAKGYKPPAAVDPAKAAADKAAADAAAAGKGATGKTAAQEIVESIKAGQESGKTLSSAGGGGGAPGLTLEQYLDMTPDQILAMQKTSQGYAQLKAIGAVA